MLIALLQIPIAPLQTLLDLQTGFQALPTPREGYVTWEQYHAMPLWFDWPNCPSDEFNRPAAIKRLLFEMLAGPLPTKEDEVVVSASPSCDYISYNDLVRISLPYPFPLF
jgi:hypothetical protein